MGSWHTAVSPCHCDNPLCCGLMFLKRKIFNRAIIKRVVTVGPDQVSGRSWTGPGHLPVKFRVSLIKVPSRPWSSPGESGQIPRPTRKFRF